MRKRCIFLKSALGAVLVLGLVFGSKATVKAESLFTKVTVSTGQEERSLLYDMDSVEDTQYMRKRNGHLMFGTVKLVKLAPTRAAIFGTTQAVHDCPYVYLSIFVDRYNEKTDNWDQIRKWNFEDNNVDYLSKSIEFIVLSGYYYSVRGEHACKHGNVLETAHTETDGLYIGITDTPVS